MYVNICNYYLFGKIGIGILFFFVKYENLFFLIFVFKGVYKIWLMIFFKYNVIIFKYKF